MIEVFRAKSLDFPSSFTRDRRGSQPDRRFSEAIDRFSSCWEPLPEPLSNLEPILSRPAQSGGQRLGEDSWPPNHRIYPNVWCFFLSYEYK